MFQPNCRPLRQGELSSENVSTRKDTPAPNVATGDNAARWQSTTEPVLKPAGDPEIERLQYNKSQSYSYPIRTPAAAWVLTTLILLSIMQKNSANNVICEMSDLVYASSVNKTRRSQPYSKRMMIFCLTLAGYSAKAYSFLRNTVQNCIPSGETLRKYRNRVDGSPGFSLSALKMVKNKVLELAADSRKLFLSLSCDDMAIRFVYIYTTLHHSFQARKAIKSLFFLQIFFFSFDK